MLVAVLAGVVPGLLMPRFRGDPTVGGGTVSPSPAQFPLSSPAAGESALEGGGNAGRHDPDRSPERSPMLTEAAGLAVLAAISPPALLVAAVFLGAASPRRTVLFYLAGAVVMTAAMAAVVFVVLRAGHLYKPREHQTRYGLRLGLGLLMLLAGTFVL